MVAAAIAALGILVQLPAVPRGDVFDVDIVCRDMEVVEVTWGPGPAHSGGVNLSLEWRYDREPRRPCPHYFLSEGGFTSGCVLPARPVPALLEIDVRKGAESVFTRKRLASAFRAWRRGRVLGWGGASTDAAREPLLSWSEAAVRVTCPALRRRRALEFTLQLRGAGPGAAWETWGPAPSCDITVGGVDPTRCYDFRVRATPREAAYGREARPSAWSRVTRGGAAPDTCESRPAMPTLGIPAPLTILTLVMSLLLLLALWRLWRLTSSMLPGVPDPRGGFRGLFERHGGDFQDWITHTEGVAAPPKAADVTADPAPLVLEDPGKGAGPPP
ncbi:cytokine receptor-like factor 2 [Cricetulus griseus]|uniref:Cytokine receptor-like factor 2 n=1 Tax=Cricetulus griseus TaxID=10029 RepID=A0A9J7KF57_CRIGR|nr:cytokine receptor-like factor 2 [Cricetulus griseus]